MESGRKYNVILLDMWLNGRNASELVDFLRKRPDLVEWCSKLVETKQSVDPAIMDEGLLSHCRDCVGESNPKKQPPAGTHTLSLEPIEVHHNFWHGNIRTSSSDHPLETVLYTEESALSAIIMLTSVNHTDSTRCKELGISVHTSKPIKRSLLNRALQSTLGTQDTVAHDKAKTSTGLKISNKTLHILIAEDNLVNQRVATTLLHKWGHTTVVTQNGTEALELAAKESFDLILMDVQMPVCDGFEATAKIREYERAHSKRRMPIVAMTAHAMAGDGDSCIAAGMDYYISKPLNAKKLQELLQRLASVSINS